MDTPECDHDYEVIGEEYDSLANGGSYEELKCRKCGKHGWSQMPD